MWSLGIILYIMLSGQPPFFHEDNFELFAMIKDGEFDFKNEAWTRVSAEGKDLISQLLTVDPNDRINGEDIMNHPWLKGEMNLVD